MKIMKGACDFYDVLDLQDRVWLMWEEWVGEK
jgi:hypothetical protein